MSPNPPSRGGRGAPFAIRYTECGLDPIEDASAEAVDFHLSAYDQALCGAGILILIIESTGVVEERVDPRSSTLYLRVG